jgi:uncharacterized RDD family membrane protein YckC
MTTPEDAVPDDAVPEARTRVTGSRVVQFILDGMLAGLALGVLGYLADRAAPGVGLNLIAGRDVWELVRLTVSGVGGWPSASAFVLVALVWLVVFVGVPLWKDRTPAMALLGLRIVQTDGTSPTPVQHVLRAALLLFEGAGGGALGWLVIVCSRRRQRIGDHVARTLVVRS